MGTTRKETKILCVKMSALVWNRDADIDASSGLEPSEFDQQNIKL